jgi:DNA-binding response OmpR family regulator
LLVDDDHDIVFGTSLRLRSAGFDVLVAHDGDAGLAVARDGRPDAIVLDVRMPARSGLDVLRELKGAADTRNTPVVMLSASLVDEQAALDGGARFFLRKPFESATLVRAVQTMFDERNA